MDSITCTKSIRIYISLILCQFFWSGVFVLGQVAISSSSPLATTLVRNLLTTFGFVGILMLQQKGRIRRLSASTLKDLYWMGFFGVFLYNLLVYYGLERTTAVNASLLIPTTQPLFTQLLASYWDGEILSFNQIVGTLLGLIGSILILTQGGTFTLSKAEWYGNGLIILASLTFSLYSIFGKHAMKTLSSLEVITYSNVFGSCIMLAVFMCLPIHWTTLLNVSTTFWISLGYIVIFSSILPYLWWYSGIKNLGMNRTAVITFLMPPFALLLAFIGLGQRASFFQILGATISLIGVGITARVTPLFLRLFPAKRGAA